MIIAKGRSARRAFVSFFLHLAFIMCIATLADTAEAKKKKKNANNMQGSRKLVVSCDIWTFFHPLSLLLIAFGQQKVQMVFITIREDFAAADAEGCTKMAKNFQSMMASGGLHVGIVGTEANQMVAVANTIRELIEIRKFATNLEEVLSLEYDKSKFVGNFVTDEERVKHNLPAKDTKDEEEHDELWFLL